MKSWKTAAIAVSAAFLLAGCGGGGGTASSTPAPAPGGAPAGAAVYGIVTNSHHSEGIIGDPVAGAKVFLVKASDVEDSNSLQPVEDLANNGNYASTLTTSDGSFSFKASATSADDYYVFVEPPKYDKTLADPTKNSDYWPGGCASRQAITYDGKTAVKVGDAVEDYCADQGGVDEITFKNDAPTYDGGNDAYYVGSQTCLICHHKDDLKHTLHFAGLRVPGKPNSLQNLDPKFNITKIADGGTTGGLAAFDSGTCISYPNTHLSGVTSSYAWLTENNSSQYFVQMATGCTNTSTPSGNLSAKYKVAFTYGGEGLYKQRYMVMVGPDGGPADVQVAFGGTGYYYPMGFQWNESNASTDFPAAWGENGEFSGKWIAPVSSGAAVFAPNGTSIPGYAPDESFGADCGGCHGGTGIKISGTDSKGNPILIASYIDQVAPDVNAGNIGCEKCHGPGSNHVYNHPNSSQLPNGYNITYPMDLSQGRLTMVCGTCHVRGQGGGILDGSGDHAGFASVGNLTTGDITVFKPGMSPAQFYGQNTSGLAPDFGSTSTSAYFDPISYDTATGAKPHTWNDLIYEQNNPFETLLADGTTATQVTGYMNHSKGHHQQYFDLVRAKMWKNDHELVTCISCHDAHGGASDADNKYYEHQLAMNADNNALCFSCHNGEDMESNNINDATGDFQGISGDMAADLAAGTATTDEKTIIGNQVMEHVGKWANSTMGGLPYDPDGSTKMGRCITCHMPKTAKSARWANSLKTGSVFDPSTGKFKYYQEGDIHSHTFDVMTTDAITAMMNAASINNDTSKVTPAAVTNKCAYCHTSGSFVP